MTTAMLSEDEKRREIKNYFANFPWWTIGMVGAGLPLTAVYGLGLVPILIGCAGFRSSQKKPEDAQYDIWVQEIIENAKKTALARTGLHESQLEKANVVIMGPNFWHPTAEVAWKRGKDHKIRYSPLDITVLNLAERHMVVYQEVHDMILGKTLSESSRDIHYSHVTEMNEDAYLKVIKKENINPKLLRRFPHIKNNLVDDKILIEGYESFRLTTTSSHSVEITLNDPYVVKKTGGTLPSGSSHAAIKVVKKMIHDLKRGV